MKLKTLFICLILSSEVAAQVKLSYSLADYLNGRYEVCDSITKEKINKEQDFSFGDADYQLSSQNEEVKKLLRKKVRIVEFENVLLVNCKKLKCNNRVIGNVFVPGIKIDNRIFFSAPPSDGRGMGYGMMFGIIGAAIYSGLHSDDRCIYMMSDDNGRVREVKKEHMLILLSTNEELKMAYQKEKEPEEVETMGAYLKALHLISQQQSH